MMSHAFARLLLALAFGLLGVAGALLALDPTVLRVASAEPAIPCVPLVTNTDDDGIGSLRQALGCVLAGGTVTFSPLLAGQTIVLTTTDIFIGTSDVTIDGSAAPGVRVDGNNAHRIFSTGVPLTIRDLIIQHGNTSTGGGLQSSSSVTLTNVSFLTNTSTTQGGGASIDGAVIVNGGLFQNNVAVSYAGGLAAGDVLVMSGTQFISNAVTFVSSSQGGGVLAFGGAWLTNGLFLKNSSKGSGGGLAANVGVTVMGTQFISNAADGSGGGLFTNFAVTATNALFQRNRSTQDAGGGLYVVTSLEMTGTQFLSNSAFINGGGLSASGPVTANGGLFQNNQSDSGGGLYAGSTLALTGTQFISNASSSDGGGALANDTATLVNAIFQRNQAVNNNGGGLFASGALNLSGTQFVSNTAGGGGGGMRAMSNLTLTGGLFQNNHAGAFGGGLWAESVLALTGTQFLANGADNGGGLYHTGGGAGRIVNALFARNIATGTFGSAIGLASGGAVQVLHTTIASPTVAVGPAIYVGSGPIGITDTIIASYTIGFSNNGGSIYQDYNLFFATPITTSGSIIDGGMHDVFGDPHFANAAGGNYHILFPSAAIDSGANAGVSKDFDGDTRPTGGGFDIGYDEFVGILQRLFLPTIMR